MQPYPHTITQREQLNELDKSNQQEVLDKHPNSTYLKDEQTEAYDAKGELTHKTD